MSASSLSITANQGPTTRRRAVDKKVTADENSKDARFTAEDTAASSLRDARGSSAQSQGEKPVPTGELTKPRSLTMSSIITKNIALLVVLVGFVQMIRWVVMNSGRDAGDFEGKLWEVENFVKTTMKGMQVQLNAIDQKIDDGVSSVRRDLNEKLDSLADETDLKLKSLDARSDMVEKFMDDFRSKSFLAKEEFGEFFEELKKAKSSSDRSEVSLDEIKDFARKIVEKEIEKHAADGLGMVDYALASGGGRVLRHSEPYGVKKVGGLLNQNRNVVSVDAEKLIKPSFGEPGQCFPLKGSSGFVEIRLRTAIVLEAITLEHVAKSVAYDRSSAPKDCRVSGWLQGRDSTDNSEKGLLLTQFTYDLEKSTAQTFKVQSAAPNLVDTVRLDFTSNHGSAFYTCIYRVRVHGREASSVLEMKPCQCFSDFDHRATSPGPPCFCIIL